MNIKTITTYTAAIMIGILAGWYTLQTTGRHTHGTTEPITITIPGCTTDADCEACGDACLAY